LGVWPYAAKGGPYHSTDAALHQNIASVTFILRNKGSKDGTEIPQLYLNFPDGSGAPPQVLRGFESVYLHKGEIQVVTFDLTRYDLSIWDTTLQKWRIPSGNFGVSVGASSRDKKLSGELCLW